MIHGVLTKLTGDGPGKSPASGGQLTANIVIITLGLVSNSASLGTCFLISNILGNLLSHYSHVLGWVWTDHRPASPASPSVVSLQ